MEAKHGKSFQRMTDGQQNVPPNELLTAALRYADEGWPVLPLHSAPHGLCSCGKDACPSPGKHPRTQHGVKDASSDPIVIQAWWQRWPQANIGLATGNISGRVVLDVDVKKGKPGLQSLETLIQEHGALPHTLQAVTATEGYHYVFTCPTAQMGSPNGVRPGIDILANGRYFLATPSIINGKAYQWKERVPEAECPTWLVTLSNSSPSKGSTTSEDIATIVKELLPHGKEERSGEWRVACPFHDDEHPSCDVRLADGVYHCFACGAKGDLVALYAHIKKISSPKARRALGFSTPIIDELNEQHAVTMVGGKCVILTETFDPVFQHQDIVLSSPVDLRLQYANRYNIVGKKKKYIVDSWLEHPDRRQYHAIVFAPNQEMPGYYNLWQGFAVEPKEGNCDLYLDHLFKNIARGEQAIYDYLLDWMAHMIQRPDERVGVSLVLRGKQGTGKGVMCTQLGKLLGKHFVHVQHHKHLLGNFNAHLKDALLVFADEAFWAGDKANEGVLKAMVTEGQLPIEYKGKDVIYVKNHVHLLVASNQEWVVPAGLEERRWCILDVGEGHMQDAAYFQALTDQMMHGGSEALLFLLQHRELKGKDLRKFPQTEALLENKMLSMSEVEKFWLDKLQSGDLESLNDKEEWPPFVIRKSLHHDYQEWVKGRGLKPRASETQLGKGLKKLVPGLQKADRMVQGKRRGIWIFPDLETCRQAFDELLKYQFDWGTLDEAEEA